MDPTNYSLVNGAGDGDAERWRELQQVYQPYLEQRAIAQGLSATDAADVVQNVWQGVHAKLNGFKPRNEIGSFRAWLRQLVEWRAHDFQNSRARVPGAAGVGGSVANQPIASVEGIEVITASQADKELYQRCLAYTEKKRGPEFVSAFLAYCLNPDEKSEKLAGELGMQPDTFRQNVKRVKADLNEMFGDGPMNVPDQPAG